MPGLAELCVQGESALVRASHVPRTNPHVGTDSCSKGDIDALHAIMIEILQSSLHHKKSMMWRNAWCKYFGMDPDAWTEISGGDPIEEVVRWLLDLTLLLRRFLRHVLPGRARDVKPRSNQSPVAAAGGS